METLGVAEAKRRFGELLDRVARGERFIVERRGKPAAALVPPDEVGREHPRNRQGLLSLVGIFGDLAPDVNMEEVVRDIYESRRAAQDRPDPFD